MKKKIEELEKLFSAFTSLAELPNKGKGIDTAMQGMKADIIELIEEIKNIGDVEPEVHSNNSQENLYRWKETYNKVKNTYEDFHLKIEPHQLAIAQKTAENKELKPHEIISNLIQELKLRKRNLILLMGMSTSNTSYFNGYLTGEKVMTKKMGLKFIEAFEKIGVRIPLKAMGLQRVPGGNYGEIEYL